MNPETPTVECYSGNVYAEHPTAIHYQGNRLEVIQVLAQARQQRGRWFRVRTQPGEVFDLFYDEVTAEWQVTAL